MSAPPPIESIICSFCGKTAREVRKMIAGPSVYICDECISLCLDILGEEDFLPPRIPKPGAAAYMRRDAVVVEIQRALEAAFPGEKGAGLLADLQTLVPPGGPLICQECRNHPDTLPTPCPEDFVCEHFRVETWLARGYERVPNAARAWPWIEILRRQEPGNPRVEHVVLAPMLLRGPVVLR